MGNRAKCHLKACSNSDLIHRYFAARSHSLNFISIISLMNRKPKPLQNSYVILEPSYIQICFRYYLRKGKRRCDNFINFICLFFINFGLKGVWGGLHQIPIFSNIQNDLHTPGGVLSRTLLTFISISISLRLLVKAKVFDPFSMNFRMSAFHLKYSGGLGHEN